MRSILIVMFVLLHSSFVGAQWIAKYSTGTSINALTHLNKDTIFAVGGGWDTGLGHFIDIVLKSDDGGETWEEKYTVNEKPLLDIDMFNTMVLYAVGYTGTIIKSNDGGDTWTDIGYSDDLYYSVCFINKDTGFVVGENIALYTYNGGGVWDTLNTGINTIYRGIFFIDDMTGYLFGDGITILKTSNGGSSWNIISYDSFNADNYLSIQCLEDSIGFLSSYSGKILTTNDTGNSWALNYDFQLSLNALQFPSRKTGYAVGWNGMPEFGYCLRTLDSASTWSLLSDEYLYNDVFFFNEDTGLSVTNNGEILKTSNGTTLPIYSPQKIDKAKCKNIMEVYPNPANSTIIILSPDIQSIIIYDLSGKELIKSNCSDSIAELDVLELARGVYIIKVVTAQGVVSEKVILQ